MFCDICDMHIHEGEIRWVNIEGSDIGFCPIHRESLAESD